MSTLLYRLGSFCSRRRWVVLLVWACLVGVVGVGWVTLGARTSNDIRLPGTETQAATDFLAEEFSPQQNGQSNVVFHTPAGTVFDTAARRAIKESVRRMKAVPDVTSVTSPYTRGARQLLISEDETTAVAQVLMGIDAGAVTKDVANEVLEAAAPARDAGIQVEAGGVLGVRLAEEHSRRSEAIGLAVGIVILAVTFGALVAAGMPILTAMVALLVGLGLIGLLGHVTDIPVVAPTLATMLGLGVGIDYALFIVFRYRDELHAGADVHTAVATAMATSGTAVVFAGVTVIIALLSLLVARVPLLGTMGTTSALAVFVSMITAITFLPAVLSLVGRRIDALRLPWRRHSEAPVHGENVWARWAGAVIRHPWISLVASLAVLLPLAAPTLTLILGQEDIGSWPPSTSLRRANDLVAEGLGPGANGRLLVATRFSPPAEASEEYTRMNHRAEGLARDLEKGAKQLERQGKALERRRNALEDEQAALERQAAALSAEKAALEAQAAPLVARKDDLLGKKERLLAEKARLEERGDALAAQGAALEKQGAALAAQGQKVQQQIVVVQTQIGQTTDPAELQRLQEQLASLLAEAQALQTQVDGVQREAADLEKQVRALEKEAAPLEAQGRRLEMEGAALQQESAALTARGQALQAQGDRLADEGAALKKRGAALQEDAAALKREKRRLERRTDRARDLEKELTRMLTDAGGEPLATDPRLVRLQQALEGSEGVASVSPPSVNDAGTAAVFGLTATTRPADPLTSDLVARLRADVVPEAVHGQGITVYVGGVTAAYDDLAAIISSRLPLVIGVVLGLSFIVLLVAFRSVLVPLKAILCNLLAVGAAFGILTAFFQWGWGLELVGLESAYGTVPIASYVPLIMFAVLFGMSTDYEVFLISQIFHAHAEGMGTHAAVRLGVGSSARVITAAAVIMVTVFASFLLVKDPVLKEFSIGLSVAILLDATIVRLVIVPATMVLLGEWNWWLPRWLQWLPRVDLPDERAGAQAAPPNAGIDPAPAD
jgi:uncharacterized membrane protein YdfJ with MMPL/SSD domain